MRPGEWRRLLLSADSWDYQLMVSDLGYVTALQLSNFTKRMFLEVLLGLNLKSAGIAVHCTGSESVMMNCSLNEIIGGSCGGGATTISCLAHGLCEGFFNDRMCFNR